MTPKEKRAEILARIAEKRQEVAEKRAILLEKRGKMRKRCGKCGEIKGIGEFGTHKSTADGHQTYCKQCKNELGKRRKARNEVARLKHHFATRMASQLGDLMPDGFVRDMEMYLGWKFVALKQRLRADLKDREGEERKLVDALAEGYHIDHIKPLSSFRVVVDGRVDWEAFRKCWAIDNLSAVPAQVNLKKGARHVGG